MSSGMFQNPTITFDDYVGMRRKGFSNIELYISLVQREQSELNFLTQWQSLIEDPLLIKFDKLFEDSMQWLMRMSESSRLYLCTARRNHHELQRQLGNFGISSYFEKVVTLRPGEDKATAIFRSIDSENLNLGSLHLLGDTRDDLVAGTAIGAKLHFVGRGFTEASTISDFECESVGLLLPEI